jgi:hypothetical protein
VFENRQREHRLRVFENRQREHRLRVFENRVTGGENLDRRKRRQQECWRKMKNI